MSLKAKWIRLKLAGVLYGEVVTGGVLIPLDGVVAQDTVVANKPARKRRA